MRNGQKLEYLHAVTRLLDPYALQQGWQVSCGSEKIMERQVHFQSSD